MAERASCIPDDVLVPSPALEGLRGPRARCTAQWSVPVELVLDHTSSLWARVIRDSRGRQTARPMATVMRIGGRLYAEVAFSSGRNALFFALDRVTLFENREGRS